MHGSLDEIDLPCVAKRAAKSKWKIGSGCKNRLLKMEK